MIEGRNALRQFDVMRQIIRDSVGKPFCLRPSSMLDLNRVAIEEINEFPGIYRPFEMQITLSRHNPPPPELVPRLVEEMCDYVNDNLSSKTPLHLASYLLWRVNWIHPFADGNGRTARAVSYVVLCILLGYELPGTRTIPEHIASDKAPYYHALEAADGAWKQKRLDVSKMEELLSDMLARQLVEIHQKATGKRLPLDGE